MKNAVSILNFIKTGKFGNVRLGMTDIEVVANLGAPESKFGSEEAFLFSYGRWEIHFLTANQNKAFLIHNDNLLYDCNNHNEMVEFENDHFNIELDFIKPFEHISLRNVVTMLKQQHIAFKLIDEDFQPLLQLENSVYMDFTDAAPISANGSGVHLEYGKGQDLRPEEKQVKHREDMLLYALGISNLNEITRSKR